jgi:hypothetical protein
MLGGPCSNTQAVAQGGFAERTSIQRRRYGAATHALSEWRGSAGTKRAHNDLPGMEHEQRNRDLRNVVRVSRVCVVATKATCGCSWKMICSSGRPSVSDLAKQPAQDESRPITTSNTTKLRTDTTELPDVAAVWLVDVC